MKTIIYHNASAMREDATFAQLCIDHGLATEKTCMYAGSDSFLEYAVEGAHVLCSKHDQLPMRFAAVCAQVTVVADDGSAETFSVRNMSEEQAEAEALAAEHVYKAKLYGEDPLAF
jgi:hypothetical protein